MGGGLGDRHRAGRAGRRPSAATTFSSQSRSAIASGVARLRPLVDPFQAALGLLVVGEHQLGLDRLDVGERVDAAVGVRHAGVGVAADDVADRVGLADRGEELVAEPLPLGGALDQAGDVVEGDRRRHQLRAAHRLADLLAAARRAPGRSPRSARSS